MEIKALLAPECELGEGIFLDNQRQMLYWVDILKGSLYQFSILEQSLINVFIIDGYPSCIFSVSEDSLIYADKSGLKELKLSNGSVKCLSPHIDHCAHTHRANDGVKLADGSLVYGTMAYNPESTIGKIYHSTPENSVVVHNLDFHIPNTFVQMGESLLISDSFTKKIYELSLVKDEKRQELLRLWKDFSKKDFTPDGGCLSARGFIHIALWDGAGVLVLDSVGNVVKQISLPVLRPTNCVIHENRWLYVSSARENMTLEQLKQYPLSGKTLVVDLGSDYEY
ncbi:SMP-30/gluconolactonase/LRE family protein [Shewanella zhangzhouensis]|uniref:SMP-30/gluconolactonase/LRE family protein n=1 Tax=Shewanella zhangzhouensis TaxID=2864213 RepID=UPI001C65B7C6|nr:SMP-30/gluconolactonase/LRE family protein [Shewanella zhangzhouensis]QYK03924.1 SMP-30/gluconolactonase/LRE family protein [Shewanella zhangzhouensis]